MNDTLYPQDLLYHREHQWLRVNTDGTGSVGITAFAQEQLGEVVYVDLPELGLEIHQFQKFGEVESVKTISDMFMPVSGAILEVNVSLEQTPTLVNMDPYGKGWLLRIRLHTPHSLDVLLSAQQYQDLVDKRM